LTVSEEQMRSALAFLWERMKLVVEPSGAVALAPVLHGLLGCSGKRVGVILSGGNADIGAVADWLRAPSA
ncbi:MAG TPA: serine dehydratase, partial [bacterium]